MHGSFITEAHVTARMGRTLLESSFFARELNEGNWGWQVINGSCGKRRFKFGRGGFKRCFDLVIKMSFSSAQFSWRSWVITVRGNHVYDWVSGPRHRIDVSFRFHARGSAARVKRPFLAVISTDLAYQHGGCGQNHFPWCLIWVCCGCGRGWGRGRCSAF